MSAPTLPLSPATPRALWGLLAEFETVEALIAAAERVRTRGSRASTPTRRCRCTGSTRRWTSA